MDETQTKFLKDDRSNFVSIFCPFIKEFSFIKEGGEVKKRDKKIYFRVIKGTHSFDKESHFATKKIVVDLTISNAILTRLRIIGMFYYVMRQKILVILDVHHPLEFSRICIHNRLEKRMKDERRKITKIVAQNLSFRIIHNIHPT